MAMQATFDGHAVGNDHGTEAKGKGLFSRVLGRMIVARQAQAQRLVYAQLASLSDEQLDDIGISATQFAEIRKTRASNVVWF